LENNTQISDQHDDEIDLRDLFVVLWAGKIKIILLTAMCAIGSVVYALSIPNQYKAITLLAPAQSDDGGGLSGAVSRLGGLASIAGLGLGGDGGGKAHTAQQIMTSWSFIDSFIAENNLEVEVYAGEGWNEGSNTLKINRDIYDVEKNEWLIEDKSGSTGAPSSWKLFEAFAKRITVAEDEQYGLVSVSVEHYSPQIAKQWLDLYIAAINKHMQERQVARVSNNIEYLEAQIEKTSITEMQEVLYTIIEEQIKNKMLAEASPDFAFVAISPSMIPEKKSQPKRASICIFGTLLGGMLSIMLVLVMHYGRQVIAVFR
jgi:LPS O-antigen subunit length determinant protein (WzzB/FepE family)